MKDFIMMKDFIKDLLKIYFMKNFINFMKDFAPETLKYWIGVQWGQSYLMGRNCLFSFGWPPF